MTPEDATTYRDANAMERHTPQHRDVFGDPVPTFHPNLGKAPKFKSAVNAGPESFYEDRCASSPNQLQTIEVI